MYRFFLWFVIFFSLCNCAMSQTLSDSIISVAYKYRGTRYSYGGSGGHGFDCSGFTSMVYLKFGYKLERSSKGQATNGRPVEGSYDNFQKGDLVLFGARRNSKTIGHVGIFIELNPDGKSFKFIHSAVKGGVIISNSNEPYYAQRFICARRIIPDIVVDTLPREYAFDTTKTILKMDTLKLSSKDKRIVLFEDNTWAYITDDGHISKPSASDRPIILDPSTVSWKTQVSSTAAIPKISASSKSAATTQSSSDKIVYHTIKSGDSLYAIAKRYHTTVDKICSLNHITTKTVLRIGKKIRVK